jgi:hypothetical protein
MKTSSAFAATLLLFLVPRVVCARERGTVADIWEQRDFDARHYIYQVETEKHVYDFLGNARWPSSRASRSPSRSTKITSMRW